MANSEDDFIDRVAVWAVDRGVEPDDALLAVADIGLALREAGQPATDDQVLRVLDAMCVEGSNE